MKFDTDREKFLVELMGVEFVQARNVYISTGEGLWSDWEYFGRLFAWAQKQDFWGHFLSEYGVEDPATDDGPLFFTLPIYLLDPELFSTFIYEFLKEGGPV